MDLILDVQPRQQTSSKIKQVRAEGYVPGVVYGQGGAATHLKFKEIDLVRLLRVGAATQLMQLSGLEARPMPVLMRQVQRHPTRHHMLHVDFYAVQMNVAVRTEVPITFQGVSSAATKGATLLHNLDRLEIECLPGEIPDAIMVDISGLTESGDLLRVSDLIIPAGVTVLSDPEEIVASLAAQRAMEEAEVPESVEVVEVISGRRDKEEAGA